jgi:hypothetical protein
MFLYKLQGCNIYRRDLLRDLRPRLRDLRPRLCDLRPRLRDLRPPLVLPNKPPIPDINPLEVDSPRSHAFNASSSFWHLDGKGPCPRVVVLGTDCPAGCCPKESDLDTIGCCGNIPPFPLRPFPPLRTFLLLNLGIL